MIQETDPIPSLGKQKKIKESVIKWALFALVGIMALWVIEKFAFTPLRVVGTSMQFSFYPNDLVLINKLPFINLKRDTNYTQPNNTQIKILFSVVNKVVALKNNEGNYFISRCIAIPGDKLEWKNRNISVNGRQFENTNLSYPIMFMTDSAFSTNDFLTSPIDFPAKAGLYVYKGYATENIVQQLDTLNNVRFVQFYSNANNKIMDTEVIVPYKGFTITINPENIAIYGKTIVNYETRSLPPACTYTFRQNYIYLNNDKRDIPSGFISSNLVPASHIQGLINFKLWGKKLDSTNHVQFSFLKSTR